MRGQVTPERGRLVVHAGAFVAPGPVDQDEACGVGQGADLPGGGDADDQVGAAGGQLLGDEHGEGCADDPDLQPVEVGDPHVRVAAGPARMSPASAGGGQVTDDVAVGVEQAYGRHCLVRQLFLPAGLPQHVFRPEHRRLVVGLDAEQR